MVLHLCLMKNLCIVFLFTLLSCGGKDTSEGKSLERGISDTGFDWLLGNWERVNDAGEELTYEFWEKVDNATYMGVGFTLLHADTIWQEQMLLVNTEDGWIFEAISKGEDTPTLFRLTQISPDSFTSENPEHDFPTKIKYVRSGAALKAVISGEGMEIPFDFERISEEN